MYCSDDLISLFSGIESEYHISSWPRIDKVFINPFLEYRRSEGHPEISLFYRAVQFPNHSEIPCICKYTSIAQCPWSPFNPPIKSRHYFPFGEHFAYNAIYIAIFLSFFKHSLFLKHLSYFLVIITRSIVKIFKWMELRLYAFFFAYFIIGLQSCANRCSIISACWIEKGIFNAF